MYRLKAVIMQCRDGKIENNLTFSCLVNNLTPPLLSERSVILLRSSLLGEAKSSAKSEGNEGEVARQIAEGEVVKNFLLCLCNIFSFKNIFYFWLKIM